MSSFTITGWLAWSRCPPAASPTWTSRSHDYVQHGSAVLDMTRPTPGSRPGQRPEASEHRRGPAILPPAGSAYFNAVPQAVVLARVIPPAVMGAERSPTPHLKRYIKAEKSLAGFPGCSSGRSGSFFGRNETLEGSAAADPGGSLWRYIIFWFRGWRSRSVAHDAVSAG